MKESDTLQTLMLSNKERTWLCGEYQTGKGCRETLLGSKEEPFSLFLFWFLESWGSHLRQASRTLGSNRLCFQGEDQEEDLGHISLASGWGHRFSRENLQLITGSDVDCSIKLMPHLGGTLALFALASFGIPGSSQGRVMVGARCNGVGFLTLSKFAA